MKNYNIIGSPFDLCKEDNYNNISETEQAAFDFCKRYNVRIAGAQIDKRPDGLISGCGNDYRIEMLHDKKKYTFYFSDSIHNREHGIKPNCYDILACMEKYDVGSIDDFISEFGYEFNSYKEAKHIERVYKATKREYAAMVRLFGEDTEAYNDLCEIQ